MTSITMKLVAALIGGAFLLAVVLAGCSVQNKTGAEKAEEIAGKLTYVKDKHGVCYATINSISYAGYVVTSITSVPCEKVGEI